MSRKLRFEYPGAIYHILNRGNYRSWIFESEGAKKSFEKTLFEACEYAGWKLHAFVVMGNHYHLALETPEPNLSEGMRWLQSVFAMRFNRFTTPTTAAAPLKSKFLSVIRRETPFRIQRLVLAWVGIPLFVVTGFGVK